MTPEAVMSQGFLLSLFYITQVRIMKISPLQIQDLDTLQDLSSEDLSPVQGGLSIRSNDISAELDTSSEFKLISSRIKLKGRIISPPPISIHPCPPPIPIRPPICTNFPTEGGHLPWCAVIL